VSAQPSSHRTDKKGIEAEINRKIYEFVSLS